MSEQHSATEYVLVKCPTCGARLHPRRALLGKRVRCPDCGVAVRVTESEPEPAASNLPRPNADVGEYALSEADQPEPTKQPQVVQVLCPTCNARLHPRIELVGKQVRCPDCGRAVTVPAPPKPPPAPKLRPAGEYRVGSEPAPNPSPVVPKTSAPDQPLHEPEPLPPEAPRLWYSTGVFNFPWMPGTVSRWGTLTVFSLFSNGITAYTLGLIGDMAAAGGLGDFGTATKTVFTMALGSIIWLLMIGYASACVLVVVRETASGIDDITDWSEAEISEGIWRILNVVFPLVAAGSLGYFAYLSVVEGLPDAPAPVEFLARVAFVVTAAATFPIMLVSTLECGAFWFLISREALRLVFGYFRGWVIVNVLAGVITGGWWLLTTLGMRYATWPTVLLGAPLWAAVILIDARLLGRFLYRANEVLAEKEAEDEDEESDSDDE